MAEPEGSEEHLREQQQHDRTTAPQSPYGAREVGIGFVVLVVGLAVAFAVPLALA